MVAKSAVNDPLLFERFQKLLDSTHRQVWTRDRGKQGMPDRLQLVQVVEVTNAELWVDYMARQEAIRRELNKDKRQMFPVSADTDLISSGASDDDWIFTGPRLDRNVNEVFLFHGTSPVAADSISTGNFKLNFAGSNAGTLYGRGVYLAENASKSDEYTRPEWGTGNRTLLVCRVTLGRPYYTDEVSPSPRDCERKCLYDRFHAVLGDRRKARGTFREFVVFDEEQIYANYILTYRRVILASKEGTE